MSSILTYHEGGHLADRPQQNRASLRDGAAGTLTRWDAAGVQVEQRPLTASEADELAAQDRADAAETNEGSIRQAAASALAANRTFLAIASPANEKIVAQTKALTRQMNALIRLALGQLDGTD